MLAIEIPGTALLQPASLWPWVVIFEHFSGTAGTFPVIPRNGVTYGG